MEQELEKTRKRMKALRIQKGYSYQDLANLTGFSKSVLQRYETGETDKLPLSRLKIIAKALQCSPAYLMGWSEEEKCVATAPKGVRINVYGSVPAGVPLEAIEDIVDWEDIPVEWTKGGQEYIALRVIGDSMYPKYLEGDTIIVRVQPTAESGQDCVVHVNGFDATLKTVRFLPDGVQLVPFNQVYTPRTYGADDAPITILGVVVEIRRKP